MKAITVVIILCITQALCFEYYVVRDLGCWKDTGSRAIPSIDNRVAGTYQSRSNAIQKCAQEAAALGYKAFAVQNGGWCASGPKALQTYKKYGRSYDCSSDGEGGPWANQVYEIGDLLKVNYRPLGCFKDAESRAITSLESRFVDLHGRYESRAEAIEKCAQSAASLGYKVFALQNGGWCASSETAHQTYQEYGPSLDCAPDGEGGPWSNSVYQINKVTKLYIEDRGCWADDVYRTVPSAETENLEFVHNPEYQTREDALGKCARYAASQGFRFFALQNGGWCGTSANAGRTYKSDGPSNQCHSNGKGGPWANQVYEIVHKD